MLLECQNRFSGFKRAEETAEAVQDINSRPFTLLRQGVNETSELMSAHEIRGPR
jgi:hypothetical protein